MAFTIPNAADSIEYTPGSGIYPQAQPDSVDWQILAAGAGGSNGVSSGCAVTEHVSPAGQSVDVASGTVVVNNVEALVTGGQVSATPAHATLPRFDLVVVNSSGTKSITDGTGASAPVFPAIPANSVVLAAVFRRPADNVITNNEIVDKRVTVASPLAPSGWTTVKKLTNEDRTSTTLTADATLKFTMAANGEYVFRTGLFFQMVVGGASRGLKMRHAGPASPVQVRVRRVMDRPGAAGIPTVDVVYSAADISDLTIGSGTYQIWIAWDGIVHNGANAGDFQLQWASINVADTQTMYEGSYIDYARVD